MQEFEARLLEAQRKPILQFQFGIHSQCASADDDDFMPFGAQASPANLSSTVREF
jgi:hypothetical protein